MLGQLMRNEDDLSARERGPVIATPAMNTPVSVPVDNDVVARFGNLVYHAGRGNDHALTSQILRDQMQHDREHLDARPLSVIREELTDAGYQDAAPGALVCLAFCRPEAAPACVPRWDQSLARSQTR